MSRYNITLRIPSLCFLLFMFDYLLLAVDLACDNYITIPASMEPVSYRLMFGPRTNSDNRISRAILDKRLKLT